MKLISIFFLLIIQSSLCIAQNEVLQMDEVGKFIHFETIEAKDLTKRQLSDRVGVFFRKPPYKDLRLQTINGDTVFIAKGKFLINKTVLVMSHPSGEILFHFQAEVKEAKFRFWLTNFSFVPYQRDRYGNFVASTNRGIALENDPGKLNEGQWKEYRVQTAKYATQFANEFKDHVLNKQDPKMPSATQKVVKKEW